MLEAATGGEWPFSEPHSRQMCVVCRLHDIPSPEMMIAYEPCFKEMMQDTHRRRVFPDQEQASPHHRLRRSVCEWNSVAAIPFSTVQTPPPRRIGPAQKERAPAMSGTRASRKHTICVCKAFFSRRSKHACAHSPFCPACSTGSDALRPHNTSY
jgi:hypothetical protein